MSRLGDGVTQTWTLTATLATLLSVKVDGVTAGFTQPNWDKVRLSVIPSVGSTVSFEFQEVAPATAGTGGSATVDLAPVLAAIAAIPVPVATSGGGVLKGEVKEFVFGSIPVGYTQIEGSVDYAMRYGSLEYADMRDITPDFSVLYNAQHIYSVKSGGYAVIATTAVITLLTDAFRLVSSTPIASIATDYTPFIMLSNGNILRLAGLDNRSAISNWTQSFSPITKAWSTLAPKPTSAIYGSYAENGDSLCVYGQSGSVIVSKFDVVTNTWTEDFDTSPADASPRVCQLPSGKLLFCYEASQYVFDPLAPSGSRWAPAGLESLFFNNRTTLIKIAKGVRAYSAYSNKLGEATQCVIGEYTEITNTWIFYPGGTRLYNGGYRLGLAVSQDGAVRMIEQTNYSLCTQQLNYTPRTIVRATKD